MSPDFLPTASIETLRERAKIITRIREFFDNRGFFEVQTPVLSRDTVVDRYIDPIAVPLRVGDRNQELFYLQTSPEFAMKRLLAAGADAIYQICPAFRADELGRHHNIEFTMLEWYRVGDSYEQGMDLLDEFAQELLGCPPAERLSYFDAIAQACDCDLRHGDTFEQLEKLRFILNRDDPLEHVFNELLEERIAQYPSVIFFDWPEDQAALARIREDSYSGINRFAERFELFVAGLELANGYHELADADELLSRNDENNRVRTQTGRNTLPVNSRLIDAMRHGLPNCCGVALGVDRLVMQALGKDTICEVMTFNSRRA